MSDKMSHKYQALREAYLLDGDEIISKYVKVLGENVTLDELVSSTMDQYENLFGVIEEKEE